MPSRIWTLILEISVYMAQFPSQSVAQKSYDYRTLGLGYANLGSLLMVQGIPYDSPEGRAQCGAITALMHAASYATSAEIAAEVGPFPRYRGQPRGDAARHPQSSPGRLQRAGRRVRRPDHHAGRHRRALLPRLSAARPPARNPTACWSSARSTATATPRSPCIAPTGTIGLVMDCDTTGVEPDFALVKFKKLAGGGYFKIINASIPPALHGSATRRSRSTTSSATARAPARSKAARTSTAPASRPRASPTRSCQRIESQLAGAFELPFVFNRWTLGDDFLQERSASPKSSSTRPGFDLLDALGFTAAADRRGQRLRLRHHDHRRRPAPEARALPGLRLRQQVRQDRPAVPVGRVAHPHDGGGPAVHLRRDLQDDQHAALGHHRRRQESVPAELAVDAQGQRPLSRRLEAEPAAQHGRRRRHASRS